MTVNANTVAPLKNLSQTSSSTPNILIVVGASGGAGPATGPVQSVIALASGLSATLGITVLAHERTFHGLEHLPVLSRVDWLRSGTSSLSSANRNRDLDIVWYNSFFDREFTLPALFLRKFGRIPRVPTILSPRGEFADGALSLKAGRKRAYLALVKQLGLTRDIWFHATESHEVEDIERTGLPCRGILEAPNSRRWFERPVVTDAAEKKDALLRIAFLGRITPVKNVLFCIETLTHVEAPAMFDLYGPIADQAYWEQCEENISALPPHITVNHRGVLPNEAVPETIARYDLFFLPTLGENFGHAINEALMSGVPALIADTTPWQNLEAVNAGWDLPLGDPKPFASVIDRFAAMSADDRDTYREGARALAERRYGESDAIAAHREMFNRVLEVGA